MLCAHCGAPIKYNRFAHGYLHEGPLGDFRISRREADDILRDPPGKAFWKRRPTYIHPAESGRGRPAANWRKTPDALSTL